MADIIKHKRSGDTGEIPTTGELVLGELAVNYYDGRLFIETYDGTTYGIAQFQPMADGDKGDVTVSAKGQTWTIDNDAVTYAKIQNVSATDRLLGRSTAGAGDIEEITCTAAGRAILDDADAAAQRTTLGLGTIATQAASSVAITGGTINGATVGATTAASGRFTTITGTSTTASTSSSTGALIVAGGAGIATDSFVNGVKVGIGHTSTSASDTTNTALGREAADSATGTQNTACGRRALRGNTANNVTGIGYFAADANSGSGMCAFGGFAGYSNNGANCTAFGYAALYDGGGDFNVAVGDTAMSTVGQTGNHNTAIGYHAARTLTTGSRNVHIGKDCGDAITTGSDNVVLGANAGDALTTGSQNVLIGSASDPSANGNSNSIVIGYNLTGDGSDTTVIGNTSAISCKLNGTSTSVAIIQGNRARIVNSKTPASASDTGTTGDVCWDASYLYVCTASNTWRRIAHATW